MWLHLKSNREYPIVIAFRNPIFGIYTKHYQIKCKLAQYLALHLVLKLAPFGKELLLETIKSHPSYARKGVE